MRVTGGEARGVPLIAPRGSETRPTADRVREAIFSILYSMDADLDRVLDLYAGTGALAIEALSRGGAYACLVERAAPACAVIRQNLTRARVAERARLLCAEAATTLGRVEGGPFTLVFLDPPYALDGVCGVIEAVVAAGLLAPEGTVVLEHAWRRPIEVPGALALYADHRYGDTGVAFFRREEA